MYLRMWKVELQYNNPWIHPPLHPNFTGHMRWWSPYCIFISCFHPPLNSLPLFLLSCQLHRRQTAARIEPKQNVWNASMPIPPISYSSLPLKVHGLKLKGEMQAWGYGRVDEKQNIFRKSSKKNFLLTHCDCLISLKNIFNVINSVWILCSSLN